MNNNANANEVGNRGGDGHGNQGHQIPEHLLRVAPRPRDVMFTLSERQLEMLYVRWDAARIRVHQQIYNPHLPFQPYPLPPAWSEEARAMMILWVARERRMFELEMQELEYLLGLRATHHGLSHVVNNRLFNEVDIRDLQCINGRQCKDAKATRLFHQNKSVVHCSMRIIKVVNILNGLFQTMGTYLTRGTKSASWPEAAWRETQ
ncbi:hypothetical protein EV424DRAFT_1350977 [Suillus variegatus]|nr:hypothetical protein EV424DRAFT_1353770 [Suillus variegatus]KAG1805778.1 hypothetical protein EV424DRAFT_1350977 [Suillus variegatus]